MQTMPMTSCTHGLVSAGRRGCSTVLLTHVDMTAHGLFAGGLARLATVVARGFQAACNSAVVAMSPKGRPRGRISPGARSAEGSPVRRVCGFLHDRQSAAAAVPA